MKQPVVVQSMKNIKFSTVDDVFSWVNSYFDSIIWDIEKDEWNKMTDDEKYQFCCSILERN